MISPSNLKLGNIPNWSLPPQETCPGSTALCRDACYVGGRKGYINVFKSAGIAYQKNLAETLDGSAKVEILRYLSRKTPKAFRIHVSGDFFSVAYIRAWMDIIQLNPKTKFYAYTRSWRVPALRAELSKLQAMPNMVLFASCDAESGPAPERWTRQAWMDHKEGALLCPGYGPKELTCDKCGICQSGKVKSLYFPIH